MRRNLAGVAVIFYTKRRFMLGHFQSTDAHTDAQFIDRYPDYSRFSVWHIHRASCFIELFINQHNVKKYSSLNRSLRLTYGLHI